MFEKERESNIYHCPRAGPLKTAGEKERGNEGRQKWNEKKIMRVPEKRVPFREGGGPSSGVS